MELEQPPSLRNFLAFCLITLFLYGIGAIHTILSFEYLPSITLFLYGIGAS